MPTSTRDTSKTGPIPQVIAAGNGDPSPRRHRKGLKAVNPPQRITKRHLKSVENGVEVVPTRLLNPFRPPYPTYEELEENQRIAVVRSPLKYLYSPLFLILIAIIAILRGNFPLLHGAGKVWVIGLLILISVELYLNWWGNVRYLDRDTVEAYTGWYTPDVSYRIKRQNINGFDVVIHRPKALFGEHWLNHAMVIIHRVAPLPETKFGPVNSYKTIQGILAGIQAEPGDAAAGDRAEQLDIAQRQLDATLAGTAATLKVAKLLAEVCDRLSELAAALQPPARQEVPHTGVVDPPDSPPAETPGPASAHDTIRQPPPGNSPGKPA